MIKPVVLACLLVLFAGCSKEPPPAPASQEAPPPAAAVPTPAPSETAQGDSAKPPVTGQPSGDDTIAAGEEVDTQDDDTPAATRANQQLADALAPVATPASDAASQWKEGVNYNLLVPARPTNVPPDKIEVVEMFWYGCAHCYALDPHLEEWRKSGKPAYVQFTRVPVTWGPVQRAHAKLFYILEALGKLDQLHPEVFREIHEAGRHLYGPTEAETMSQQLEFAKRHGISEADFRKAAGSMGVDTKLRRAEVLTRAYQADTVPRIIVNGKYSADVTTAGGQRQLIALITDLAAREQKRQ